VVVRVEVEIAPRGPDIVLTTENQATEERLADVLLAWTLPIAGSHRTFSTTGSESLASPGELAASVDFAPKRTYWFS
jgi:hypothetical protein